MVGGGCGSAWFIGVTTSVGIVSGVAEDLKASLPDLQIRNSSVSGAYLIDMPSPYRSPGHDTNAHSARPKHLGHDCRYLTSWLSVPL